MDDMLCKNCQIRPRQYSDTNKNTGKKYYKKLCVKCNRYPNLKEKAKQKHCDICFKEYHFCAMDVDHIDPNGGEGYKNLRILCAVCHRIKTHYNKESSNNRDK
jgi:hypothetical protein